MNNVTTGPVNRWRGLVFLCISLLVISLDNTVVNVALPSISNQLGGSDTDLQWIVAAYILVFAALLLTMGALGDRIGRKRVLQFGLLWFGAGSLLAALSPSTGMLILSRAFLGVGGAMIMPSTLSLISATFLNQKERFQAIAIWGAMFGVGSALGPVVGGLLLQVFDWKAVFLINLPVIAVALIGGAVTITESRDTQVRPFRSSWRLPVHPGAVRARVRHHPGRDHELERPARPACVWRGCCAAGPLRVLGEPYAPCHAAGGVLQEPHL